MCIRDSQTLFFSATMPPEITRLVNTFLKDPARVEVAPPATTAKTITQLFRYCPSSEDWEKREVLRDLIRSEQVKNAIIFCNRKRDVAILLKSLQKHGFNAGALHGDMDQMSRMDTLAKFRDGTIAFLAASDVAARGLDIPEVSHVFNFDVPWQADDYVHRIGRTGRAGKEGRSLTIVTIEDIKQLKDIEKMVGEPVSWIGEPPTEEDIAEGSRKRRGRGASAARRGGGRDARDGGRRGGEAGARSAAARGDRRRPERGPARPERGDRPDRADRPPERRRAAAASAESGVERLHHHHEEHAPPSKPAATRPAADKPARQRAERGGERGERRERKPPRQPWEPREPQRRDREDRTPTPVGLGDHVPAFLRRPTRPTSH